MEEKTIEEMRIVKVSRKEKRGRSKGREEMRRGEKSRGIYLIFAYCVWISFVTNFLAIYLNSVYDT